MNENNLMMVRAELLNRVSKKAAEAILKGIEQRDENPLKIDRAYIETLISNHETATATRIYWPENVTNVIEQLCVQRFGMSSEAMKKKDTRLFEMISAEVAGFQDWRRGRFCAGEIDTEKYTLDLAVNLVFDKAIKAKLTEAQRKRMAEAYKNRESKQYPADELREAIRAFLREGRAECWTQAQIVSHFDCDFRFAFHRLEELVAEKKEIVSYNVKSDGGKLKRVWKFAPLRVKILIDHSQYNCIVQKIIIGLVGKSQGLSKAQVYQLAIKNLGQVDEKIVRRNIDTLLTEGIIRMEEQSWHSRHLLYIA